MPHRNSPLPCPDFDDADQQCSNCGRWLKCAEGKRLVAAGVDDIWVCNTRCAKDLARFAQDSVRWPNGNRVVPSGTPVAR